uniref:ferroxidase n=1 Tax=Anser brachyrhynchus TaxID=132585 RepID=A0A8B9BJI4_9AVES
ATTTCSIRELSQVHQNCHHECKATVNGAAITELHAAYVCLFIALHFKGDDVANQHSSHMLLLNVKKPECDTWGSALEAVEAVLQLQRSVNQAAAAEPPGHTEKGGPHLCDFLESHYMDEQVNTIKHLRDLTLPRGGAPSLELFKTRLDEALGNLI